MARVVHFGKFFPPHHGGIESVTRTLAVGAAAAGHDVTVVCFSRRSGLWQEIVAGVRVLRSLAPTSLGSQPLSFLYCIHCLRLGRRADIVHLHAPNVLASICALLIPSKTRLLVHWHSDILKKGIVYKFFRPIEFLLLRRADCIVATSRAYADASKPLKGFKKKIVCVPIGVANRVCDSLTEFLDAKFTALIGQKRILLAVGRLVAYKGFDILIEAARFLPDDTVVLIVGEGAMRPELQLAIVEHGVTDRVLLTGGVNSATLYHFFERATLFCLPSTYRAEAFGVVLLEAMSFGLPIVATDIPGSGVPWVNQNNKTGFNVRPGDAQAFAEACNKILKSDPLRHLFSRNARERFRSKFSEEKSVETFMHIYERFASVQN